MRSFRSPRLQAKSRRTDKRAKARNDLRSSLPRSLHTYTQPFGYAQALHNRNRPLLDYQGYLPNLPQSPDNDRPTVRLSGEASPEPLTVLARPACIPFDHTTTVGLPYSLTRHIPICPPTDVEPRMRSGADLWPTDAEPRVGSDTNLGSTITNLCATIMVRKSGSMHGKGKKKRHGMPFCQITGTAPLTAYLPARAGRSRTPPRPPASSSPARPPAPPPRPP